MAGLTLDYYTQVGFTLELLAQSEYHKQHPTGDYLRTEVLPAIWNKQARFYLTKDGQPKVMVTWAWLNADVEKDIHKTGRALTDDEWNCGDHLFFNDWISPYGNIRDAIKDMTSSVFPNERASGIRRNKDGSVKKICYWTGKSFRKHTKED